MRFAGVGAQSQRLLECFERVGVVLFAAVDNPQQVVAGDTAGIQPELFLNFLFGFFDRTLTKQRFRFRERGWDCWNLTGRVRRAAGLLRCAGTPANARPSSSASIPRRFRPSGMRLGGCGNDLPINISAFRLRSRMMMATDCTSI